ncbi:enoyl-CoA hydratase (plasmid) [Rhodococcus opacus]|uniref:Enoyl-CoA hydratase n=2 Tax=Rhodococcus opacus TaxID=37919 RepID=A0A076EXU4_RHOOP|nr:enoyl-CoA hydratase [Rhodococcus opacus]
MSITSDLVRLTAESGVATITLDSPHNRNALSAQLRVELSQHIESALRDDTIRVLVLTHTGPAFCAGADLREARNGDTSQSGRELVGLLESLMTSNKPVVARLTGPARAGGLGLVTACDFAIAADTVTFAFTEVRLGVIPSIISVPLRLRVLPHALHRLFLTGAAFSANYAAEIGLISTVTTADDLDRAIDDLTGALQLGSPGALAGVKTLLNPPGSQLHDEFREMLNLTARFFSSAEAQEGIRAFTEKRQPVWVPGPTGAAT